jgi:tRNA (cmo5U34)-methyltransferase
MKDNTSSHSAQDYDAGVRKTIPFYSELHHQTLDLVNSFNPEVKTWLDTGCGTGILAVEASSMFTSCKFFLSDPSSNMLEICQQNIAATAIEILGCYATHELPVPENTFDIITAIQSHHYLSRHARLETSQKCYSLLKPGGMYITFENFKPQTDTGIMIGLDRWVNFQCNSGKTWDESNNHRKRFGTEYFPITIEEHIEMLNESGFETVELFWVSYMQAGFYAIKRK